MTGRVRMRFWVEVASASLTGLAFALTLAWRDWIEHVFHWDPDHHGGGLEWGIVLVLLAVTLLLGSAARAEWRRVRPAAA